MPPAAIADDDDEHYASSEDSDFAPDAAPEAGSDHSDSDDADDEPAAKRRRKDADADAEDAGYDNSGDEAIIEKGKKRRRRHKEKGRHVDEDDDEGGEGGLIKTRRQRAAEKEERKYTLATGPVTVDVDALWAQMLSGQPTPSKQRDDESAEANAPNGNDSEPGAVGADDQITQPPPSEDDPEAMVLIKRTYNFAGRVHTEEKLVPRESAEAKLFFASQGDAAAAVSAPETASPTKRATRKAFRSAFEPAIDPSPQRADLNLGMAARMRAGREAAQAKKLNTVEKSRMDWAGYVDQEGIKDDLELAGKSKDSYAARQDFLARSEARREDDARHARMAGRA